MTDPLTQLEKGVRREIELIWPDAVMINIDDDDTLDSVDATPAVHVAITGGIPKLCTMNTVTVVAQVSVIVVMKHLGGEDLRRYASYPIVHALMALLPNRSLKYEDENGVLLSVDADELVPKRFSTLAETETGIAFRIEFESDVDLIVPDDDPAALMEIFNRYFLENKEVMSDLVQLP